MYVESLIKPPILLRSQTTTVWHKFRRVIQCVLDFFVPVTLLNPYCVSAMQYSMRWLDKPECVKDEMIVFNKYLGKGVSHKFLSK